MIPPKTGVSQLGPFKLLRKLGEGGMGAVYLAEDTRGAKKVALKILPKKLGQDPDFVKRFKRETELGTKLRHAHIVGAVESGEDQGYHYYVMEYCEGEALDRALKRETRFAVFRALEVIRQIAEGLRYAHDHAVVHRDIKPSNIIITPAGTSRLLDLGLSKDLGDQQTSFKTASGAVVGTPHYISPEQASGEKKIDGRTDIYSLGATLYHLLTGDAPFAGSTTVEVLYKHVHGTLPNPQSVRPEIPDSVVHVLRRMMAKSPDERYRDCSDLISDLDELIGGKTPQTVVLDGKKSSVGLLKGSPKPAGNSKKPVLIAGSVVAASFAIIAGVFLMGPKPQPQEPAPKSAASTPASTPASTQAAAPAPAAIIAKKPAGIDLLALIDPARDAVKGGWTIENGRLVSDGENATRLEIPYVPPDEYDLRLTFVRRSGNDAVSVVLPHANTFFLWQMGGWENSVFGLSEVDGKRANENPTTVKRANCLENGREYTTVISIRKGSVTATLNGEKLVDWKTTYADLAMNDDWRLRQDTLPGVGTWGSVTEFRAIQLQAVSGNGRALWPGKK